MNYVFFSIRKGVWIQQDIRPFHMKKEKLSAVRKPQPFKGHVNMKPFVINYVIKIIVIL